MKQKSLTVAMACAFAFALLIPVSAMAQLERRAGQFYLGAEAGAVFSTPDSTAFGLGVVGDYFIDQNLSIGPLIQMAVTSGYFHFGPSAQLKYTADLDQRLRANLQGGIGFIYSELTRGRDRDDTSFLIPVGGGLEYRFTDNVTLSSTLLFNFTDLEDVRGENFFVSLLGGVKIRF